MIDILYTAIALLLGYFLVWQRLNVKFLDQKQGKVIKLFAAIVFVILFITAVTQTNAIKWSVLLLIGMFCIVLTFFRAGLGSIIFKNYRIRSYREFTSFKANQVKDNETEIKFYSNKQVRLAMKVKGKAKEVTEFLNNYFV
ncbi:MULTISPECIES: hypothetical protein [Holzapfeliella]